MRPAALRGWFLTSHERAAITSSLKKMYAVVTEYRVGASHKESLKNRVLRDERDVQKLMNCFTSNAMTDPFSYEAGGEPFNFATGLLLPTNVADSLLSSTEKGREQIDTFVKQRLETSEVIFWNPVPNLKVKSFISTMAKKTNVKANDRVITVNADRDLFGRLLIAANTREFNLKEQLSYELSEVPFALSAHQDGSIRKYITNPQNKISLCDFLTSTICSHGKEQLADGKKLGGGGYKDGEIAVSISNGASEFTEPLACSHEEADTRLVLHAKHASSSRARVIIQSPDTDELVLCATHFESIGCEELWFKTSVRDHLRYVPVHRLSEKLGQKLCMFLPAFHALTECDTTSTLAGASKKAWKRLSHNEVPQEKLELVVGCP